MRHQLLLGVILLGAGGTLAHEFWLEAPHFRVAPGQTVALRPLVGEEFHGEPWTNQAPGFVGSCATARPRPTPPT